MTDPNEQREDTAPLLHKLNAAASNGAVAVSALDCHG
jgi:hypothetical protein